MLEDQACREALLHIKPACNPAGTIGRNECEEAQGH